MTKFYQLLKPYQCLDVLQRKIWRVEAAVVDPDEIFYLHVDGVVKDNSLAWPTTADYSTEGEALAATEAYYAANAAISPSVPLILENG